MKPRTSARLSLHRETLHDLELLQAKGGVPWTYVRCETYESPCVSRIDCFGSTFPSGTDYGAA